MAEIIEMPKLSDTMEEGAIASWLKKEGEFIEEGEAFVEIETDKATMEYNSPAEGVLLKILVEAGQNSELNQPIAVVGEKGEDYQEVLAKAKSKPADKGAESRSDEVAKADQSANAGTTVSKPGPSQTVSGAKTDSSRLRASPLAKKMAQEHGLDLSQVKGSGPQGRIVMRDVEEVIGSGESTQGSATEFSASQTSATASVQLAAPIAAPQFAGDIDKPVTMMRKTIAKRLLAGKNDAPHFYLTRSINMAQALEWRKKLNADPSVKDGKLAKVSVNDVIILAVSRALLKHPAVNSSWQGSFIRQFGSVDISMAVAIDEGLITPIIKGAHVLGVRQIAAQSRELALKAKDGRLQPEEYQGGTFSISNLGMMGIEEFTAIINPPQAAILAVGATLPTPAVDANGALCVEQRMKVTMSCDHRVIDGATGARFLQTLAENLEDPLAMLS